MAKNKQKKVTNPPTSNNIPEISEEAEKIFKKILKIMSWTVGLCFLFIIILPLFENVMLDNITKILFYVGAINLVVFTVLEFISDAVKNKIQKIIELSS